MGSDGETRVGYRVIVSLSAHRRRGGLLVAGGPRAPPCPSAVVVCDPSALARIGDALSGAAAAELALRKASQSGELAPAFVMEGIAASLGAMEAAVSTATRSLERSAQRASGGAACPDAACLGAARSRSPGAARSRSPRAARFALSPLAGASPRACLGAPLARERAERARAVPPSAHAPRAADDALLPELALGGTSEASALAAADVAALRSLLGQHCADIQDLRAELAARGAPADVGGFLLLPPDVLQRIA